LLNLSVNRKYTLAPSHTKGVFGLVMFCFFWADKLPDTVSAKESSA